MFQERQLDRSIRLRYSNRPAEIEYGFRRVAAPADSGDRGHAGIVPSANMAFLDQREQLPLAQERIRQVEPVKFYLLRMIDPELIEIPVVQRPVILELERANGMGDPFHRV